MAFELIIEDHFEYVILTTLLISLECIFVGFLGPGMMRSKIFSQDFMKRYFETEHRNETGEKVAPKGGYPDMGCGVYSSKLSYADWYKFNNAQRAHMNFLESLVTFIIMFIIGGIKFPIVTSIVGLVYFLARLLYSVMYIRSGPQGRLLGALIGDLCLLVLLVMSFWSVGIIFNDAK